MCLLGVWKAVHSRTGQHISCYLQIDKCFGFESAVEESQRALLAGYVEAASARSGLGLIKLMGRQSGYIAMQASMASGASLLLISAN